MNKFRIVLSLVVAVSAVLFALRHRALQRLHTEQEQLQQQSEEVSNLQASIAQTKAVVVSTNAGLSAAERSELLRLRGQIGGLRQEVAQATNQLAKISRTPRGGPSGSPEEPAVTREEMMQKMSRGKRWMVALLVYASDNNNRFPATLTEAVLYGGPAEQVEEYEFILSGIPDMNSITAPSRTIVLREKQPWKNSNGRWSRSYAFADGHVELASSDTGDFTEWERTKTSADPAPGQ